MNPAAFALLLSFAYSLLLVGRQEFGWPDFLPLLVLMSIRWQELSSLMVRLFGAALFSLVVALSILIFHGNGDQAGVVFLRSLLILAFNLLLFVGYDAYQLAYGLKKLGMGKKLPALLFFTGRLIEMLRREHQVLKETLQLRGFHPKTGLFSYKIHAYMVGGLIHRAIHRVKRMQETLEVRHFVGRLEMVEGSKMEMGYYGIALVIVFQAAWLFRGTVG